MIFLDTEGRNLWYTKFFQGRDSLDTHGKFLNTYGWCLFDTFSKGMSLILILEHELTLSSVSKCDQNWSFPTFLVVNKAANI